MPACLAARISVAVFMLVFYSIICSPTMASESLDSELRTRVFGERKDVITIPVNAQRITRRAAIQGIIGSKSIYLSGPGVSNGQTLNSSEPGNERWCTWYRDVIRLLARVWKPTVPGQALVYVSIKGRDQISIVQVAGFIPGVGSDGSIVTNAKSRFRQEINADIQHARGAIALSLPSGTKMQEVAFWAIFGRDDEAIFEYPDWYWFNSATNSESLKALRAYLLLQADGYRNAAAQVAFMLKVPITKQSRASDKRFKVYRNDKGIPAVYRWVDDRVDANFAGVLAEEFNASTSRRRQLSILYGLIKHRVLEVPDGSPKVPFGCSPPGCSRVRARSFGNIAPYRKHLMKRLAEQWHPKKSQVDNLEVLLELSSKGELLSSEIFQSSGDKTADTDALEACRAVKYEPLPSWYRGDTLTFKIEFARVHPLKGK